MFRNSTSRWTVRTAVPVAAAAALVVAGAAVGIAATGDDGQAGLCVAEGSPVTGARTDGSGGWTCPSGRTLVVVPALEAVRALRASVDALDTRLTNTEGLVDSHFFRLNDAEQRLTGLEEASWGVDDRLSSAEARLTGTENGVADARRRLLALESRVSGLEARTSLRTVSSPVSFSGSAVRRTVSCETGKALSGSVRTTEAAVVQSAVTDDGAGWAFEVRPTGKGAAATLLVVCAGAPGTPPTPPTGEPGTGGTTPTEPGTGGDTPTEPGTG